MNEQYFKIKDVDYRLLGSATNDDSKQKSLIFTNLINLDLNQNKTYGFDNIFICSKTFFEKKVLEEIADIPEEYIAPPLRLGKYLYYEGGMYNLLGAGFDIELLQPTVVYNSLYSIHSKKDSVWVKDRRLFFEDMHSEKLGYKVPRYRPLL